MTKGIYIVSGEAYIKLDRNEIIKKNALQSWDNGKIKSMIYKGAVGKTPSNFSDKRDFYNLIDLADMTN